MKIYNYHPETFEYTGESLADPNPLEPGQFLIPAHATTVPPLEAKPGNTINFENGVWVYKEIPPPEPIPEPIKPDPVFLRRLMYQNEADPLFFKAQRGEATLDEWKAKVAEIKAREVN